MSHIDPTPLTAEHLRALRQPDATIYVHSLIDDEGYIHSAEISITWVLHGVAHRLLLNVPARAAYSGFLRGNCCDRHAGGSVGTSLHQYNQETIPTTLGSIMASLKQGDNLQVEWREAGNTSPVMEEHGMIMDQLVLCVHRPRKGGKKDQILIFDLDHVITTSDSSARWFRPRR